MDPTLTAAFLKYSRAVEPILLNLLAVLLLGCESVFSGSSLTSVAAVAPQIKEIGTAAALGCVFERTSLENPRQKRKIDAAFAVQITNLKPTSGGGALGCAHSPLTPEA